MKGGKEEREGGRRRRDEGREGGREKGREEKEG